MLSELENGSIHLTGLFLLSAHLTPDNVNSLLPEARGRTRREIETILASWFPRSDVLPSITPLPSAVADISLGIPGNASANTSTPVQAAAAKSSRVEPLSATSYRIEFTASDTLRTKIEQARNVLAYAVPSGDLAQLFERALDALLSMETKRRLGAGGQRRRRPLKPGSRHVPVELVRAVWERDGSQCTFVDLEGRRCAERRFLAIEHREPFARGGPATLDNLCLLCAPHNALRAREAFGAAHIEAKRLEALAHEKTLNALTRLGFERRKAKAVLETLRSSGARPEVESLLRGALAELVT